MTVETQQISSGPYIGDGVSTRYRVVFPFVDEQDLSVSIDGQGLTLNDDYIVIGAGDSDGGEIVLASPLRVGSKLTIKRQTPITQLADYAQGDAFPAESHEMALDKLTMIAQEQQHTLNQGVYFDIDDRKNGVLYFDEKGLPKSLQISNGLIKDDDLLKVNPGRAILINEFGVHVLVGDGVGIFDNAVTVKIDNSLDFDSEKQIKIRDWILETIQKSANDLVSLQGLVNNLAQRVVALEGGGEVSITFGDGLSVNVQGEVVVRPSFGIKVDANGVGVRVGEGLGFNADGDVVLSQDFRDLVATLAEEIKGKAVAKVGDQWLSPFRAEEAGIGWYFMNGDNYLLDSPQGQALNALSDAYKSDWGIAITETSGQQVINVPNYFAADGRAYFERAANGSSRQAGSVQDDCIRRMQSQFYYYGYLNGGGTGAFSTSIVNSNQIQGGTSTGLNYIKCAFDTANLGTPFAQGEVRPINIGKIPLIYLGV